MLFYPKKLPSNPMQASLQTAFYPLPPLFGLYFIWFYFGFIQYAINKMQTKYKLNANKVANLQWRQKDGRRERKGEAEGGCDEVGQKGMGGMEDGGWGRVGLQNIFTGVCANPFFLCKFAMYENTGFCYE